MTVEMTPEERARLRELAQKDIDDPDEDAEFGDLARLRHVEILQMTPTPPCCEAARSNPAIIFSLGYGEAGKDPGEWVVATFDEVRRALRTSRRRGRRADGSEAWALDWDYKTMSPAPKFCPFCGAALPKMKLKDPVPAKLRAGSDGNYCSTCGERLSNCLCDPPESAYEPAAAGDVCGACLGSGRNGTHGDCTCEICRCQTCNGTKRNPASVARVLDSAFDASLQEVREGHLRAYLRGETILTPSEIRAVVAGSIRARDEEIQRFLRKER